MQNALDDVASSICQALVIGTFAAHPLIMGSMNEFLRWVTTPAARDVYSRVGRAWRMLLVTSSNAL